MKPGSHLQTARRNAWRFLFLFLFLIPLSTNAQLVTGRFITSVQSWEQFDTVGSSRTFTRGFQSAIFDIAQGDFSLHTHFQAATMLQTKLDELPDYRMYYLYGKWRDIGGALDFSFGRLPYFAGVGTGTLDGVLTTVRALDNTLRLTVYGGANVPYDLSVGNWGPLRNNFTLGGQIVTSALTNAKIGVSYMDRRRERDPYWATRLDSLLNPFAILIIPEAAKEQYVSGDASYQWDRVRLYGRYDYDLNYEKTQRGQIGLSVQASDKLSFSGEYIHRAPRLAYNSFFSVFNVSDVDEFEAGCDYVFHPAWRGFVRGAYVKYTDDNSLRYTAGIVHNYVGLTFRGGSGYAGELTSLSLQGAYPLLEKMLIPNAGISFVSYKLNDADTKEDALAGSLGATVRPAQFVSVDLQVQWLKNKVVENDVRFFGRLNLWFSERLTIFE